jgi:hypothetical protein
VKTGTLQKRQQAYAEIMGRKFLLSQHFVSRFETEIHSDFYERMWLLSEKKNSISFKEAERAMHKSHDLALEISKIQDHLFQSIGLAMGTFPKTPQLDSLIEPIYRFPVPIISPPPETKNPDELVKWKTEAVTKLHQFVKEKHSKPIDDLLKYLHEHLDDKIT